MRLIAVRHTSIDVPLAICYGRLEAPLSSSFAQEYRELLSRLELRLGISNRESWTTTKESSVVTELKVFTSPLTRCRTLAVDLCRDLSLGQGPVCDDRLLEFSYASWEGLAWDEIPEQELRAWSENWTQARAGDGESLPEMLDRVSDFCRDLTRESPRRSELPLTLAVTHSGVIRCLSYLTGKVPLYKIFSLDIPYGCVAEFELPANGFGSIAGKKGGQ